MVRIEKNKYICEICGAWYRTKHEAEECESRGPKPKIKVGDAVQIIVDKFAPQMFLGKTGIVNRTIYIYPSANLRTTAGKTEPHILMHSIRLDGEDDELMVGEGFLEII